MTIRVTSTIPVYERHGEATEKPHEDRLKIMSHWNRPEFVILHLPGDETVTVCGSDLCAAIQNAQNSNKF